MKKIRGIFLLCIYLFLPTLTVCAKEEPENLYAQSATLMDADSGRILFEKDGKTVRANASTTKILTCILALENGKMDDRVKVSKKAAAQPKVHLGMREGQEFYLEDLLYSLMLESHNDTAVAVAEHIGGSVEGFADMMNKKASEIGCSQTHFVSPNGLDWEDEGGAHGTTAADLALMLRYCVMLSPKKEEFLNITRSASKSFADADGQGSYSCVNHNAFLSMMEGALTGKTGFTGKAGYCYVGALRQGDRTFVISLLACGWPDRKTYKWSDARTLFEYGLNTYRYENVKIKLPLKALPVENGVMPGQAMGDMAFVELSEESEKEVRLLLSREDQVKIAVTLPDKLKAPVGKGTKVGGITYLLNGEAVKYFPVLTTQAAEEKDYFWCLWKVLEQYLGTSA